MSDNSEREVPIKNEESDKNLNINVQIKNLEDYNIIDDNNKFEQKNINNDFLNLINNNIEDECYNENDDMNFEQESINKSIMKIIVIMKMKNYP